MAKYRLNKKVNLGFLGEGWDKAEANFNRPTVEAIKAVDKKVKATAQDAMVDTIVDVVKGFFIDGTGVAEDGELIPLDISEMPLDFYYECYTSLLGGDINPKS